MKAAVGHPDPDDGREPVPTVTSEKMSHKEQEENKVLFDVFAWCLNVATSVAIVFVNKVLMDPNWGYKFVYATCLCSLHFFVSSFVVWAALAFGLGTHAPIPLRAVLTYTCVASTSVASLNLSLLVNSVGFYQISKLLIIPFVCGVEFIGFKKRFTWPTIAAIMVVILGVSIVTVTDVNVNFVGFAIALVSVITSGMQQIMCGNLQRTYNITSNQLLANTAHVQGFILLAVGPFVDKLVTDKWIMDYQLQVPAMQCLALSCAVAVLVNISQFMCLGRFAAVTFQVLGHAKTVLVLLVGWLCLGDNISSRKFVGMVTAVMGMIAYGIFSAQRQSTNKPVPGVVSLPSYPKMNSWDPKADLDRSLEQGEARDISFGGKGR